MPLRVSGIVCAVAIWVLAVQQPSRASSLPIKFTDVTSAAGVTFRHVKGGSGRHYYPEQFGAGVALLDYDRDGFLDLFFVQGAPLPGYDKARPSGNALYRNNGDGTFTDVTRQAGLSDGRYGLGVASADYDNDGYPDLFITNLNGNTLYRNNRHGHFVDVTSAAHVSAPPMSTGAAFFDYDNDGWLDLFVARYTDYSLERDLRCIDAGSVAVPVLHAQLRTAPLPSDTTLKLAYCGPAAYRGTTSRLYHNNHNGTFADVTERAGIGRGVAHGLGVGIADFNEDGRPDVFVASDMTPNLLFVNAGNGTFREQALTAGVALGSFGKPFAGMGVDAADYDNDGHIDLFVTNYENEPSSLYRNNGNGTFSDQSFASGIAGYTQRFLKWACRFVDLDLDGRLDLFVLNGHVDDNLGNGTPPRLPLFTRNAARRSGPVPLIPGREGYPQHAQIFQNDGLSGHFTDVSSDSGPYFMEKHAGRGAAFGDFDNDGDWDVFIVNNDEPAVVLRNDTPRTNQWVRIELQGKGCNRDAIGARVTLKADGEIQTRYVPTAGSYLSESDRRLLFGVPRSGGPITAEITWPCGATQSIVVKAGESSKIVEENCKLRKRLAR